MGRSRVEDAMNENKFPILIYQTGDGLTKVNVTFDEDYDYEVADTGADGRAFSEIKVHN